MTRALLAPRVRELPSCFRNLSGQIDRPDPTAFKVETLPTKLQPLYLLWSFYPPRNCRYVLLHGEGTS